VSCIQLQWFHGRIERMKEFLDVQVNSVASFALIAGATLFLSTSSAVAESGIPIACTPVVSADQRLRMEQWAIDGHCASPVRTRVTDRYLGFTCSKGQDTLAKCRTQPPVFDSKAFRMGHFRQCFDAIVTSTEMGFVVNRVREWVTAEPGNCEWDPGVSLLSVEMDLENARVCIEDQCISITKLSVVGRLRLVRTILEAFNQPS
jgi:hypothetical protein